jgi:hypothetical protein
MEYLHSRIQVGSIKVHEGNPLCQKIEDSSRRKPIRRQNPQTQSYHITLDTLTHRAQKVAYPLEKVRRSNLDNPLDRKIKNQAERI